MRASRGHGPLLQATMHVRDVGWMSLFSSTIAGAACAAMVDRWSLIHPTNSAPAQ